MTGTLIPEGESFPAEKLDCWAVPGLPWADCQGGECVWGRVGALGTESWLSRLSALELLASVTGTAAKWAQDSGSHI